MPPPDDRQPSRGRTFVRPWRPVGQREGLSVYLECRQSAGWSGGVLVVRARAMPDDETGTLQPVSLSLRDSKILERLQAEQTPLPLPPEGEQEDGA